jgi:hypothetical protein
MKVELTPDAARWVVAEMGRLSAPKRTPQQAALTGGAHGHGLNQ